jgi:hypothetical protein
VFAIVMLVLCVLCAGLLALAPITPAGKGLIVACVPIGGILGFALGIALACGVFEWGGNLCGLVAIFITGPIGSLVGGITGWFIFRRRFAAR